MENVGPIYENTAHRTVRAFTEWLKKEIETVERDHREQGDLIHGGALAWGTQGTERNPNQLVLNESVLQPSTQSLTRGDKQDLAHARQ